VLREIKFDADEEAVNQIEKYVECGYVVKFPTLQQAKEYVGGDLVLSDLVVLEKMRADGTVKRRVILNCKTSGISAASAKAQKVCLPRAVDIAHEAMDLMRPFNHEQMEHCTPTMAASGAFGVTAYVNDVVDAYWNVPVARAERRCTCSYEQHKGVEEDHSCGDV